MIARRCWMLECGFDRRLVSQVMGLTRTPAPHVRVLPPPDVEVSAAIVEALTEPRDPSAVVEPAGDSGQLSFDL